MSVTRDLSAEQALRMASEGGFARCITFRKGYAMRTDGLSWEVVFCREGRVTSYGDGSSTNTICILEKWEHHTTADTL